MTEEARLWEQMNKLRARILDRLPRREWSNFTHYCVLHEKWMELQHEKRLQGLQRRMDLDGGDAEG